QAQAATGMEERFGDGHPVVQPFFVSDYGTGVLGAFAVGLALYQRARTGESPRAEVALASTATWLQARFVRPGAEPRGLDALGEGPAQRLHRARDGWLFAGGVAPEPEPSQATVAEAIDQVREAGGGAHRVVSWDSLPEDPDVRRRGLVLTRAHAGAGELTHIG